MKRLFHLAALLVLLIAAGLAGFPASYILGTYDNHVIARFDQAGRRAAATWERMFPVSAEPAPRLADAGPIQMRFSTVFVPLQGHVIALPRPEQPGAGGSLTSWGDQLVVITHEGGIYLVGPDLTV